MRLLFAAAALLTATSASAVTFINGDFEAQSSGFSVGPVSPIEGWRLLSPNVTVIDGAALLSADSFGGIMQRLRGLDVGQHYRITFDVFSRSELGGKPNSLLVSATGAGSQTFHFGNSTFSRLSQSSGGYSYDFYAAAVNSNVQFRSIGKDPLGTFIDNIAISLVPEPATWALMITGFGLVGAVARRRNALRSMTA